MKYSNTLRPFLKLLLTGVSITSPDGLDINPRIPTSCLIWLLLPRAADCNIINTELNGTSAPSLLRYANSFCVSKVLSISLVTCDVIAPQISMIFDLRSPLVITPSMYKRSISVTSFSALSINSFFFGAIIRSLIKAETPALVE